MPPNCKKCGKSHYGYQDCSMGDVYEAEARAKKNRDDANISIARFKGPEGFHALEGYGDNASSEVKPLHQNALKRLGRLTYPDKTYDF